MFKLLNVKRLRSPILIVAPHPDDDVISSGGLIQRALKRGKAIYVLYITVGDAYGGVVKRYLHKPLIPKSFIKLGKVRHREAIRAERYLGIPKSHLFFMAFPDSLIYKIATSASSTEIYQSNTTHYTNASYPFSFRADAPYNKQAAIQIIKDVLTRVKPGTIILPHAADIHLDHKGARILTFDALRETTIHPTVYSYLVHYPNWPAASGMFLPPRKLRTSRIRKLSLTANEFEKTKKAFQLYRSQYYGSPYDRRFVRNVEYFWRE